MRRPLLLLAALAVTVSIFAIRLAPASIADARLARITLGALRLSDTEGTVWNGRGFLEAGTSRMPVAWRIDPWPLLRGELRLRLVPEPGDASGTSRADIALRGERLVLRDVDATFPAGLLMAAAGPTAGWAIGGDLDVSAADLQWSPPANRGDLRVRWRAARLTPPGNAPAIELGDVSVLLNAEGDRASGPVANVGGDLAIRGEFALRAQEGIQLSVVLTPRRADSRELAQTLSVLGTPDGDGWRVALALPLR